RRTSELDNKLRSKGHELEEAQKRVEKLEEHIRQSEASLDEQKRLRQELQGDVGSSKERISKLHEMLDSIVEQLGDARVDKHEDSRRKKRQEIVENFKQLYSGVYDRMINMCQPIHKRYNVAITKVLGKYMEAIVVDTEKTARQCVQYLKDQMLDPETFLPLDYIQAKPLKERLRNISEPRNVKLLYDVLQYDPPEIKRAVLFATNNALVCETPDDASKVAYEMEEGHSRYDAVALDGTFFFKSGIISGGSLDLARKAKRWDEKHLSNLKQEKEKLSEELREAMKNSRKESELNTVESQIRGLETRLKYSKSDKEQTEKQIVAFQREVDRLKSELETFQPQLNEIEKIMAEREATISDKKEKMNSVEDVVFAEFCKTIGVEDIRQYEDQELRAQTERANKRLEFEKQRNRVLNQLEFERSRDTQSNVAKWERAVQDDEDALEQAKQAEQKQMSEIDKAMRDLDKKRSEKLAKKSECDEMDDEIGKARREVGVIAKDIQAVHKQVNAIEHKMNQKKADRHSILKQCKMEDTLLPMTRGNMDDIENETSESNSLEYSSGMNTQMMYEKEARIQLDYSQLSEAHKELDDSDDVRKQDSKLNKHITELLSTVHKIQAPNMKAMQKLEFAREKLKETNTEFDNARKKAKKAKQAFEKIKKNRYDKFSSFFEHVSNEIDGIYKALAKNPSAQAFLGPENPEEPYLDGINYNCVAPGKRFQPMSNLSGGEKTIAALALLFAVHSYQPAPFFVLDEIDAALDNTNIGKVASYIVHKKKGLQTIVISLKEEFYQNADALVGICPDPGECLISRVLTMDLSSYPIDRSEPEEAFAR
ncbi:SMCs flexible hinge, partial [Trinorchestia longiramus]